jgi:hypothetical protein
VPFYKSVIEEKKHSKRNAGETRNRLLGCNLEFSENKYRLAVADLLGINMLENEKII